MCEDVAEQPFKDACIAVNRDVDFIVFADLLQAFVEIFHVADKKRPRELEVTLLVLIVINDMDHDSVFHVSGFS